MTNNKTALSLSLIVLTMIILVGFSVPLYDFFFFVTGYGGKTNVSEFQSSTILERDINLKFNADVNDSINWSFKAPENIKFKVGENMLVKYRAENLSNIHLKRRFDTFKKIKNKNEVAIEANDYDFLHAHQHFFEKHQMYLIIQLI